MFALLVIVVFALPAEAQSPLHLEMVVRDGHVHVEVFGISYISEPSGLDELFYPAWASLTLPTELGRKVHGLMAITLTAYIQLSTRNPLAHVSDLFYFMLTEPVYLNVTDELGNVYQVLVGRVCNILLEANVSFADVNMVVFRGYNLAWKALHVTAPLELKEYGIGVDFVPFSKATLVNASVLPTLERWKWYFNGTHTIARYWSDSCFCTSTVGGRRACYEGIRAEIVFEATFKRK